MKDIKYYDKDIERKRVSIVETLTVIIVFLISFWVGYVTGVQEERSTNEKVSNMSIFSMYENTMQYRK